MNPPGDVPARGDLVWISLDPGDYPSSGGEGLDRRQETTGRRAAVVVSPERYNAVVGLALFCPVTSLVKGYPWEVAIPEGLPVSGVVLSDQVKSLDWRTRRAEKIASLPPPTVAEILGKLRAVLGDAAGSSSP